MSLADSPTTHTIVICTKNRTDGVGAAVASAIANRGAAVVIVDQNDDHRIDDVLAAIGAEDCVQVIRTPVAGAGRARNLGLAAATTDIVCFTDDDCVLPHDYAETISAPLIAEPELGMVFCSVAQAADSATPGYAPLFDISERRTLRAWTRSLRPEDLGIGAGMAVRKAAVESVGGFDPWMGPGSTFPSADDRELALRLLLAGHGVADVPNPTVQHYGHRSAGAAARALTKRDFVAMGGMLAKFAKAHAPGSARIAISFIARLFIGAATASFERRRPTEFGKPWWALVGIARGLRSPVDPATLVYDFAPLLETADQPT